MRCESEVSECDALSTLARSSIVSTIDTGLRTYADSSQGKMNDMGIVLRLDEDDHKSPFVAGMEDVEIEKVDRARECTLTNKPYPFLGFRSEGRAAWPNSMSKDDIKKQIFHGGRLACRVVNILYPSGTRSKPYSGIVRHLYTHEADATATPIPNRESGLSCKMSIAIDDTEEPGYVTVNKEPSAKKRRARDESPDFEILDHEPSKRKIQLPSKQSRLVFGDVFCGTGGASPGAAQAGYYVQWGLDNYDSAFAAYRLNHPGAYAWKMNAHDFLSTGISKKSWKVDVHHLSPPCCYWSPVFTPRELSPFQSFPYVYEFTGANSEATKQIGNTFPPIMAQAIYQTMKKTLEAFEKGFVRAEDDLSALGMILEQSGESAPQQRRLDSFTGSATPSRPSRTASSRSARASTSPSTRNDGSESMQSRRRNENSFPSMNLLDGVLNGINNFANRSAASVPRTTRRRGEPRIPDGDDEVIYIPSDSEETPEIHLNRSGLWLRELIDPTYLRKLRRLNLRGQKQSLKHRVMCIKAIGYHDKLQDIGVNTVRC